MSSKPFAVGVSLLAVACGLVGPESGLSQAASTYGCGPAGGSIPIIMLAQEPIHAVPPTTPYVTVAILQPTSPLAGHTWSITSNGGASAQYVAPGLSQPASSGSITITSVDSASTVDGSVDLQFSVWSVATRFHAPHVSSGLYCN